MLAGQQGGAHGGGSGRADGAGQLGEPVPDDRGAEHTPGPGDRKRPEPAPEGLGQVGQVPGGPERDLPCLGVLGGERGDDGGQGGEPVAFGRMGADVTDQADGLPGARHRRRRQRQGGRLPRRPGRGRHRRHGLDGVRLERGELRPGAVGVAGDVHRAARLPGQCVADFTSLSRVAHPRQADARGGRVRGLDDTAEVPGEAVGEQRVHRRARRADGDRAVLEHDDAGSAAAGVDAEDPAGQAPGGIRQAAVCRGRSGAGLAHPLTLGV